MFKNGQKATLAEDKMYTVLRHPIITEKATNLTQYNQHTFKVATWATKTYIKLSVEKIFKVKVKSVKVLNVKGKVKRFRNILGRTKDYKKAIICLEDGHTIDTSTGLK